MTELLAARPLPGAPFGVEITGGDPGNLTAPQREQIWDAHRAGHGLICFSFDRLLEADELHALTAVFGDNEFAPGKIDGIGKGMRAGQARRTVEEQVAELRARGDDPYMGYIGNLDPASLEAKPVDGKFYGEWEWHTDMSYIAVPPTFSLLHARVVPDEGGDTGFCSQTMAARELPPALRKRVLGREIKHDSTYGSSGVLRPGMTAPASPIEAIGHPHPIIRIVPETGPGGAVSRPPHQRIRGRHAVRRQRAGCWTNCGATPPGRSSAIGTGGGSGRWWCGTTACCCTCAIRWPATRYASCGARRPAARR